MWELRNKLSRGRISLRTFSLLASTILLACFATIGPLARQAFAEDAIRQDENTITYQGKTFTHIDLNGDGKLDHLPPNLPAGTDGFINFTDPDKGPANLLLTQGSYKDTISFQYVSYEYKPINQFGKLLTTTPTTVNSTDAANHRSGSSSNCSNTEMGAIGWIICPVTTFLAKSMDFIYRQIEDFFAVNTISADTNSSLHRMWSIVRDIANLCFVIAFLFVIFSQITNVGLSNHGIKAMLPRLIIAAILVNLSYVICAIAVDTSNVLGSHLHGLFHSVLQQLNTGTQYDNTSTPSNYYLSYWEKFALAVLGGAGTVVTVYGAAVAVNAGTLALLLPILAGAILSALVAFLILAARQALIVILVIISPLAFVAYILPNTEKYFDKWKDGFMTLLLLFPIFSIVFSGAQLAGLVIIQNAHDNIITVLLGMAVQVAPLFITPLLLKFSGGILNRVAGIVNNPNKGLVDRTRNLANGLYQQRKNQVLGKKTFLDKKLGKEGTYKGRGNKLMRRAYKGYNAGITAPLRGASNYQANVKARRALYEAAAKNSHDDTKKAMDIQNDMDKESTRTSEITNRRLDTFTGQQIAHRQKDAEREKSRISNIHQATWDEATLTDANQKSLHLETQASQERAAKAKGRVDEMNADIAALGDQSEHVQHLRGATPATREQILTFARSIQSDKLTTSLDADSKAQADRKVAENKAQILKETAKALEGDSTSTIHTVVDAYGNTKNVVEYAAGIMGDVGKRSVVSRARREGSKFLIDDVQNIESTTDNKLATDVNWLYERLEDQTTTFPERIAYSNLLAKAGGPGVSNLKKAIAHYDQRLGNNIQTSEELQDYKDFMRSNGSFMGLGKDLEFWATNNSYTQPDGTVTLRSFDEITKSSATWGNISPRNLTTFNVASQFRALQVLYNTNREAYDEIIQGLHANDDALLGELKLSIRKKISDVENGTASWDQIPDGLFEDSRIE